MSRTKQIPTILDAAEKVRRAAQGEFDNQTSPGKIVRTTPGAVGVPGSRLGIPPGNKGLTYKATPPTMEEAQLMLETLARRGQNAKLSKLGQRNYSLMSTILYTGLRIHEALLLRERDVDFENNSVHVVRGKGGKERWSVITDEGLEGLRPWLDMRRELGFTEDQPIFCVIEGSTRGGPLNQAYVRTVLHRAARDAGIDKRLVPHQWRHFHALHLHRMKVPLGAISKQLGHSNTATTSTYLSGMSSEEIRDYVMDAFHG